MAIRLRLLERRKKRRYEISAKAKILLPNSSFQMACEIVEISNAGARLCPADAALLPNEFELLLSPGKKVKCEAVHRTGREIGVRFYS